MLAAAAALLLPGAAQADFPGGNGKILYFSGGDAWTINPDGTGAANVTNTPATTEDGGAWSPDGGKIAVIDASHVWVMNADGSGKVDVTPSPGTATSRPADVTWSPDS